MAERRSLTDIYHERRVRQKVQEDVRQRPSAADNLQRRQIQGPMSIQDYVLHNIPHIRESIQQFLPNTGIQARRRVRLATALSEGQSIRGVDPCVRNHHTDYLVYDMQPEDICELPFERSGNCCRLRQFDQQAYDIRSISKIINNKRAMRIMMSEDDGLYNRLVRIIKEYLAGYNRVERGTFTDHILLMAYQSMVLLNQLQLENNRIYNTHGSQYNISVYPLSLLRKMTNLSQQKELQYLQNYYNLIMRYYPDNKERIQRRDGQFYRNYLFHMMTDLVGHLHEFVFQPEVLYEMRRLPIVRLIQIIHTSHKSIQLQQEFRTDYPLAATIEDIHWNGGLAERAERMEQAMDIARVQNARMTDEELLLRRV